ncbi:MAG: Druantia anti-phage system protein DruA, partial [Syntrophobacteria bacterium]
TERSLFTEPKPPLEKKAGTFNLHCEVIEGAAVRLWNEFIDRYHYLGYSSLAGAQLRYFIKEADEILALLSFSAAAWKTAPRDRFIGWDKDKQKENLHLVVNNSRFLLLPWVRSKNLASRILSLVCSKLPEDWFTRYGYRPVLAETFVEKERFAGTCYQAANWICVGETRGRGKMDRYNTFSQPVKTIWLYPLTQRYQERLWA